MFGLPPRAPELNPQENIWQFMRANWLSNRIFKSFDEIVDHCCYAWNTLIDPRWRRGSLTSCGTWRQSRQNAIQRAPAHAPPCLRFQAS
jgi:hypothetical protein